MFTHNSLLFSNHPFQSRPISWPMTNNGISFWFGKPNQVIYFIGNPIIWGAALFCGICLYLLLVLILSWKEHRGINVSPGLIYFSYLFVFSFFIFFFFKILKKKKKIKINSHEKQSHTIRIDILSWLGSSLCTIFLNGSHSLLASLFTGSCFFYSVSWSCFRFSFLFFFSSPFLLSLYFFSLSYFFSHSKQK